MLVAIAMTLFVALPWHYATWRPASMPLSWVQPAFAAGKLTLIFVAMTLGLGNLPAGRRAQRIGAELITRAAGLRLAAWRPSSDVRLHLPRMPSTRAARPGLP